MSINLHHPLYISTSLYQSLSTPIDFFQPLSVAFIVYESLSTSQSVSISTNLYDSQSISVNLLPPSCVPSPRMFPGVGGSGPQALGICRPQGSGVRVDGGRGKSGYLNQKLATGGRGPLHTRRKNLSYWGRLWRPKTRLSYRGEPNSVD